MNKQKTLIFSLSAMLFLAMSFIVYSWAEPITTMPGSYTPPINTSGTAQTKTGEFGASSFIDADDSDYYINPSGNSVVSGKIVMEDSTASIDVPTTVATKGYVDTEIARVESAVNGSLPLVYNMHTREACTTAGGEVVDSDVSLPICRFSGNYCPLNWTQYKSYSAAANNSATVTAFAPHSSATCSCYASSYTFRNQNGSYCIAVSCNTYSDFLGSCQVCYNQTSGYDCWGYFYGDSSCSSAFASATITQIGCY